MTDSLLSEEVPKVSIGEVGCDDHDWFALGAHTKEGKNIGTAEVGKNLCLCKKFTPVLLLRVV